MRTTIKTITYLLCFALVGCFFLEEKTTPPLVTVAGDNSGPVIEIEREANDGQTLTIVGKVKSNDVNLKENVVVKLSGLKDGEIVFVTEKFLDELVDGENLANKKEARFGIGVPSNELSQYELELYWGDGVRNSAAQVELLSEGYEEIVEEDGSSSVVVKGNIRNLRSWPVTNVQLSARLGSNPPSWLDHPSFSRPGIDGESMAIGEQVVVNPGNSVPFELSIPIPEESKGRALPVIRIAGCVAARTL